MSGRCRQKALRLANQGIHQIVFIDDKNMYLGSFEKHFGEIMI